ncbi:uncharacterized protein ACA1_172120 [Acanthamoeba castellanii str. Neff]|uniref:Uncharacterized protein n=1 Tax=Acanthamoeba castellanii (strain ATCC 30010 / Neff) TaxID=1257118 RepID=L8HHF6_ACACF|nr:uncharacterized protein ACA1_172120 [Acanthamoeba castellanii str. Neff]ELR24627.1 hypothetical protein ACA1_172120 [Acanthamoeba castellanii str. Neff]
MKRQKIMIFSTLPIIAGGIVYTVGYARKIPDPGSRGASIIATIGAALVLYGLLMRLFIIQSTKSKGSTGRFLKLTSIDLYVLGAGMFVLTNAVYIVGTRSSLRYGGTFGVIAGGLFSAASLLLALALLYDLFALRKGGLRSRLRAGEGESA